MHSLSVCVQLAYHAVPDECSLILRPPGRREMAWYQLHEHTYLSCEIETIELISPFFLFEYVVFSSLHAKQLCVPICGLQYVEVSESCV